MKINYREPRKARIEIIPLIDVIFFCLATFVLVTLTMNKNRAEKVTLAAGSSGERPSPDPDAVTVSMKDNGSLYWGTDPVSYDQLLVKLAEFGRTEEPILMLNFDERAQFGQSALILDEVRKSGIGKVQVLHRTSSSR